MFKDKNKLNKLFFLNTLILLVVFVLGGCLAKEIKQVKSNPQAVVVEKKVEIESGKQENEIDTSDDQLDLENIGEEKNNEKISINKEVVNNCKDNLDLKCWDTYRNEEFGFEFKYPKKLNQETDIKIQETRDDRNDKNKIIISFLTKKGSFAIFPNGEFDRGLGIMNKSTQIIIDNKKATRQEYNYLSYITFDDYEKINKFFRIELNYYKGYENDKNLKNILNEILQTFKFINQDNNIKAEKNTGINDWQIFNEEQEGIKNGVLSDFKFPNSWYTYNIAEGTLVTVFFSDGGVLTEKKILEKDVIKELYYNDDKKIDNECRFALTYDGSNNSYVIKKNNFKLDEKLKNECNTILFFLESQVKKIKDKQVNNKQEVDNIIDSKNVDNKNQEINTDNWLTYKNEELHYQINYPSGFELIGIVGEFYNNKEYPSMGVKFFDSKTKIGTFEEISINIYDQNWIDLGNDLFERNIVDFDKKQIKNINDLKNIKEFSDGKLLYLNNIEVIKIEQDNNKYFILQNPVNLKFLVFYIFFNKDAQHQQLNEFRQKILFKSLSSIKFINNKL
jgi:hypothetical protein